MAAVLVFTLAVEVPIDNKINGWTVVPLPPDWEDIRARWAEFHTRRTFLSLAAVAAAVGAALAALANGRTRPRTAPAQAALDRERRAA